MANDQRIFNKIVDNIQKNPIYLNKNDFIKSNVTSLENIEIYRKYETLIDDFGKRKICSHCGNQYTSRQNYMNYLCWLHVGYKKLNPDGTYYYTCCRNRMYNNSLGCVPCMHTNSVQTKMDIIDNFQAIALPKDLVESKILPLNTGMVSRKDNDYHYFSTNLYYIHEPIPLSFLEENNSK